MQSEKTAIKTTKPGIVSKIIKRALLAFGIYAAWMLLSVLPDGVRTIFFTAIVVGYLSFKISALLHKWNLGFEKIRIGTKRTVTRFSRVASLMAGMSDEEFEYRFPSAESERAQAETKAPETTQKPATNQQPRASFIPNAFCKSIIDEKAAHKAALLWWEGEKVDGLTGMQQVSEIVSAIACENPSKHTCILTEYEELALPTDAPVMAALIDIMKENGLDADLNDDKQLIIHWIQYDDGKEAAQAHAELK